MTSNESRELSPLAAEIGRLVTSSRRRRVLGEELLRGTSQFEPGLVGSPDMRRRFREALGELQAAGEITLPSPRSRTGWDTRITPPLPAWVMRVEERLPPRPPRPTQVWPSALEAAAQIATRPDEYELLERIARWMRDNPAPSSAPIQERSLELFDDEKALDGHLKTRLFATESLTLELLACFIPAVPFVSEHLPGAGPTQLLVFENLATYTSFLTTLKEDYGGGHPDLHVAWGIGNSFTQSVLSVPNLSPVPRRALYFGDLDVAGLNIASIAARKAELAGLPPIVAAAAWYRFLLSGPLKWRKPDSSNRSAASDFQATCQWLPSGLREAAMELLNNHKRIPQERLGLRALRENPQLLAELASNEHP
jgi:hypothetical protein